VAKGLKQESYGLVFGINTFMALLFQTILTLIVADQSGLALGTKDQVLILKLLSLIVFKKYLYHVSFTLKTNSLKSMVATISFWVLLSSQ